MKTSRVAVLLTLTVSALMAADPGITLVGTGFVPGDSLDQSGLTGTICDASNPTTNCIPRATMGGFGSGITYSGHDDVFLAVPDRGPFNGLTTVPYLNRFYFLHMTVNTSAPFPNISTVLLDTRFLKNEAGQTFVGDANAFNVTNELKSLRLDPEAIRASHDGNFFISDEYGPYVFEFDREGHLVRRVTVPAKFLISNPTGQVDSAGNSFEIYPTSAHAAGGGNDSGRQANRGMEGLAITPDGKFLVGILQNALIQDHGLDSNIPPGRVGLNNRIVKFNLSTGETHEYVYVMDAINKGKGVNEMLAINDHEFLVLERDNQTLIPTPPATAAASTLKRIYKIDLNKTGLTDVSGVASLPTLGTSLAGLNIVPVTKTLFIDLLDSSYKVDATHTLAQVLPEKLEGMAWGPDLADGRHLLYVVSDNDLFTGLPTKIYAFAVDGTTTGANIAYEAQELPGPLYPPGQVKKALDDTDKKDKDNKDKKDK